MVADLFQIVLVYGDKIFHFDDYVLILCSVDIVKVKDIDNRRKNCLRLNRFSVSCFLSYCASKSFSLAIYI